MPKPATPAEQDPDALEPNTARTIIRAADVLTVLAGAGGEMRVTDVAEQLGIPKGSAHRALRYLATSGLVSYIAERKTYALGGRILALGLAVLDRLAIRTEARTALEALRELTGESAGLFIRVGTRCLAVERALTHLQPKQFVSATLPIPLHETSAGVAILAYESATIIDSYLDSTPEFAADEARDRLIGELEATRRRGCALMSHEHSSANAVAFPLINVNESVLGSIMVTGPANRWTLHAIEAALPGCFDTTRALQQRLAYMDPVYLH